MNHPADPRGTHKSHCCVRHGCKYGEPDCPVASGEIEQLYDCEECAWDTEEDRQLERIRKKAEICDDFIQLCTHSNPLRLMESLGELYQKALLI